MTPVHGRTAATVRAVLPPAAAAAAITALDVVYRTGPWNLVASAVLDEPTHLLTAALLWCAIRPRRPRAGVLPWVVAGSVAIDLDHLPLYLGHPGFLIDGGRPPTHSLTTVAVLALLALVTRRYRSFGGLAVGVLLHFVRDVATGPGLSLGWPVFDASVHIPFLAYGVTVWTAALVAAFRRLVRRPFDPPAPGPGATSDGVRPAAEPGSTGRIRATMVRLPRDPTRCSRRWTRRTDGSAPAGREPA